MLCRTPTKVVHRRRSAHYLWWRASVLRARPASNTRCHVQEVKRYEEQRKGNKSTYWVIFELTWRDYYRYFTMRSGNAIFMEYGITNKKVSIEWRSCQ